MKIYANNINLFQKCTNKFLEIHTQIVYTNKATKHTCYDKINYSIIFPTGSSDITSLEPLTRPSICHTFSHTHARKSQISTIIIIIYHNILSTICLYISFQYPIVYNAIRISHYNYTILKMNKIALYILHILHYCTIALLYIYTHMIWKIYIYNSMHPLGKV